MKIQIKILNKEFYKDHQLPAYSTAGSAAMDLVCTEEVTLYPGEVKAIRTGLAIHIGSGCSNDVAYAAMILPRSGLGTKGLILANTIGLIDSDYQGELIAQAWNRNETVGWEDLYLNEEYSDIWVGLETYRVADSKDSALILKAGDRFAQLTFVPVAKATWEVVEEFTNNTTRGVGGFGSTGK